MIFQRVFIAAAVCMAVGLLSFDAHAGEADVIDAKARKSSDGAWSFDVTVKHDDEGWDHYANRWDVLAPDGTVLGTRTLHHPHENEQPFTRSLGGVKVPDGVKSVILRANDSVHEIGGAEFELKLP